MIIIIASIIILLLLLIALLINSQITTINNEIIKINESKKNIEIIQEKQISLFSKLSKSIKKITEEKVLNDLTKIKNKNMNIFELDNELYKLTTELKDLLMTQKLNLQEEDKNLISKIKTSYIEIKSLKEYHNNATESLNNMIRKFYFLPGIILTHAKKQEEFTIEKEVDFEILKPQN